MDDLLSLDFASAAPTGAQQGSNGRGNAQPPGRTNFDYLSSMQTASPNTSRSASPFASSPVPTLSPPLSAPASSGNVMAAKEVKAGGGGGGGGDAFSSLFGAPAAGTSGGTGLSMAERLGQNGGGQWGGSANGRSSPALSTGTASRSASPALPLSSRASSMNVVRDPWDFDLLAPTPPSSSRPPPSIRSPTPLSSDSLDPFDSFATPTPVVTSQQTTTDEFDLLGLLSAPISHAPPPPSKPTSLRQSSNLPRHDASSPPPHILGQMVEMGFSVPQARVALLSTKKGGDWNIEAALEVLVLEGETEDLKRGEEDEEGGRVRQRERRRSWEDDEEPVILPPRPVGRRAREAAAKAAEESSLSKAKVQEQANELLAQASKLGFSVFKSANAYWETGRATIVKKLEERADEGDGGRKKGKGKERPRWMVDAEEGQEVEEVEERSTGGKGKGRGEVAPVASFMDSDEEVIDSVLPQRPSTRPVERRRQSPPSTPTRTLSPPVQPTPEYRSPHRRPNPPTVKPTPRAPTPVPAPKPSRPPRANVSASSSQLSASTEHKTRGNDLFKLGRFSDADTCYTQSIDALPASHLDRIPLYNNRAIARLKVGDEKNAAEDCTKVIEFVVGTSHSSKDSIDFGAIDEDSEQMGGGVNLREQLGKALSRRAKAFEAMEKWKLAGEDWTTLLQAGEWLAKGAGGSKIVSDGVARSRKMLEGGSTAPPPNRSTKPIVAPKPKVVVQSSGDAVKAHRAANDAAEAEDDLRFALQDDVDARINAWKGGKETNLRALIASLDNVLWKELGWVKVGMHELISEGQLKVRYVRAIAKVHPDKLNVGNTTVEQRMIAGGVFSGLNDAWNAAKA